MTETASQPPSTDEQTFPNDTDIVIRRYMDAPPERVYAAFTDPETIDDWWSPDDCVNRTESMDVRVGGLWLHTITVPDGTVYPNVTRYVELSPPHRIVVDHGVSEDVAPMFRMTLSFDAHGPGTLVELRQTWPSKAARDQIVKAVGAVAGGHQTLAHIAARLGSERLGAGRLRVQRLDDLRIQLDRILHAPAERIWAVVTDPATLPDWWGPARYTTTVEEMDVCEGGRWRFVQTAEGDPARHVFFGEYLLVEGPKHIRQTFVYEPFADFPATEEWRLSDLGDGRTLMTVVSTHLSKESLDGYLATDMESGADETWSRLETLARQ